MKKTMLLAAIILLIIGCKKEDGPVDVTIQNRSLEAIALKLTDSRWVAIGIGSTHTFYYYETKVLESTQVFWFTADNSEAYGNVLNCGSNAYGPCSDEEVEPPYNGDVEYETFNLKRERSVNADYNPPITILAEQIDSLSSGAEDRGAKNIRLRILN
ncbi:MAG: hypothetical protein ACKVU0_19085 [Saprospiraceae bacterium]